MEMSERNYAVYILVSQKNGTLYVGVTNDLHRRIYEHKQKTFPGFTQKYGITKLVYAEYHPSANDAISREKSLKRWKREWKLDLIESINPEWNDLAHSL
jgi:putative endonuclease